MTFQNGDERLDLDIVNYETDPEDGERNWLVLRGTWVRDGQITKDSSVCLLTYELRELDAGLKILRAGIRDAYAGDFASPGFSLDARAAGKDRFAVDVSFYLPNTMDGDDTAEVSCVMDTAELRALTDELDRLCAKFPDRT